VPDYAAEMKERKLEAAMQGRVGPSIHHPRSHRKEKKMSTKKTYDRGEIRTLVRSGMESHPGDRADGKDSPGQSVKKEGKKKERGEETYVGETILC